MGRLEIALLYLAWVLCVCVCISFYLNSSLTHSVLLDVGVQFSDKTHTTPGAHHNKCTIEYPSSI